MLNLYANEKNFILIGYSFGSILTLKIAKLLEDNGKSGKIMLVDGSPKFIHQVSNLLVQNEINDEHLQETVLKGCIKVVFRDTAQEMTKKIFAEKSLDASLEEFLLHTKERSSYSSNFVRQMIHGLQKRLKIAVTSDKISFSKLNKSSLTLFKPSEISLKDIENDYGLKDLIGINVDIKSIDGDHLSILTNPTLAELVNQVIKIN